MNAKLFAYLSYPDAAAALEWMERIGFDVVRRQDGASGQVLHAEVRLGDAVLMVASDDADYQRPALVGRSTGQGFTCWSTTSKASIARQWPRGERA